MKSERKTNWQSVIATGGIMLWLAIGAAPAAFAENPNAGVVTPQSTTPNNMIASPHAATKERLECDNELAIPRPLGIFSSIWDDGSVSIAIPLQNTGDRTAGKVALTEITVPSGERIDPSSLPLVLGDVFPNDIKKIDARFKLLRIDVQHRVITRGTYTRGDLLCKFHTEGFFTPERPSNEPVISTSASTIKFTVNTALFPPNPPQLPEREFNGVGILSPQGQPLNFFTVPSPPTSINKTAAFSLPSDPDSVLIIRNTVGGNYGGFPPDPSVAGNTADDVVMFTANTGVSYSADSGLHFTTVALTPPLFNDPANPSRNRFFPQDDAGLCCDQVLTYIPQRNLFVWLLLYWPPRGTDAKGNLIFTGPNRLRIAWATPNDIKSDFLHAWTWVDLTSAGLGIGNDYLDYPDMAFSDNFLYVGVDHGITNTTGKIRTNRHIFVRLSLNDIANPNISTVGYDFMNPSRSGLWVNHITQSSADAMYSQFQFRYESELG